MKDITRIMVTVISVIVLFGVAGCSPGISQEEYDKVKSEFSDVKLKAAELQSQLDEAETAVAQYDQLNSQYQELKKTSDEQVEKIKTIQADLDDLNVDYNTKLDEIEGIQAGYDSLNQEYEDLKDQYDTILQGSAIFSEDEINQALFELINQERKNNGRVKLEWAVNLYGWARQNSVAMAETGDFKYSSWLSVQAVLITSGQATLDRLVNGIMEVWKQRTHEYSPKILNATAIYGAVAVYRSGDVYYITYLASTSP